MSIEFNPGDPSHGTYANDPIPRSSKMVEWVMKTGLVRDEKQANYVLVVAVTLLFIASIFLITSNNRPSQVIEPTPEQNRAIQEHKGQVGR